MPRDTLDSLKAIFRTHFPCPPARVQLSTLDNAVISGNPPSSILDSVYSSIASRKKECTCRIAQCMAWNRAYITNTDAMMLARGLAVKGSESWIRNRILLSLDQRPCHGYDLLKSLPKELNDLRLTTLYRWLHTMESEGYVESDIRPGPHGPDRRIYRLGPRGENRLRDLLKESIETVLHFYDAYRYSVGSQLYTALKDMKPERVEGRTLFAAIPWLRSQELDIIRFLAERNNGSGIDILGDTSFLRGEDIKTKELKGDIVDIPASNDKYAEIWLSGVPFRESLQRALSECKRVLAKGGVLRVIAPFAYFGEPERPTVDEFIRVTAVHLLPDLGVVEGRDVASLMESLFSACGALETLPGLVVFWAQK